MTRAVVKTSSGRSEQRYTSFKMRAAAILFLFVVAIGVMTMTASSADSKRDAHDILQVMLNSPHLVQYYHFDSRPERAPLRIVNRTPLDIAGARLTAGGQKVELSTERTDQAIEITDFKIAGDTANIVFSFRVEGVVGRGTFKREQGTWKVEKLSVAER